MVEEAAKGEEACGKLWRRASAPIGGGGGGEAESAASTAGVAVRSVVAISAAGRWRRWVFSEQRGKGN